MSLTQANGELVSLTKELENCKSIQRSLEQNLKEKENDIRNLKDERLIMEELSTINEMMVRKMDATTSVHRVARNIMPQDTFDKIIKLDNLIKHFRMQTGPIHDQHALLIKECKVKEDALQDVRAKIETLKTMVSWDARIIKSKDDFMDMENKVMELKKRITLLQDEQHSARITTQTKTKAIEELAYMLETFKDVDSDLFNAQTTLKLKEREMEEIREDMKTLDRIAVKKDRLLQSMSARDDQKKIKDLETRKNILRHEITKSLDQRRANERSLVAQQSRVETLQQKLRIVVQVILARKGGMNLTPEEFSAFRPNLSETDEHVSVELFEGAHCELLETRTTLEERDLQLTELDSEIESLENKISVLARAKACAAKRHVLQQREQEMETAQLEAFMQVRNDAYQSQLEHLSNENQKLGSFLRKVQDGSMPRVH